MGFPTKIQLIKRKASEQWYINFPSAVAQAMEFDRGEVAEWIVEDKTRLTLKRNLQTSQAKKKRMEHSLQGSTSSGKKDEKPSIKSVSSKKDTHLQ